MSAAVVELAGPLLEVDEYVAPGTLEDGESVTSATTSLASSIRDFHFENGRRYHDADPTRFFTPNDDREAARLELHHHLITMLTNGALYRAPLKGSPKRVLDLGTGTGTWAIDFADMHPDSNVLGIDITPIQPICVPPNLRFEIDDIEEAWTYNRHFDYIHARYLSGSIHDWPRLAQQSLHALKPGAWLELQDWDLTLHPVSPKPPSPSTPSLFYKLHTLLHAASHKAQRPISPGPRLKPALVAAGFVHVAERRILVPLGATKAQDARQRELGKMAGAWVLEGLEAVSLRLLTGVLGWEVAEVKAFLDGVRDELKGGEGAQWGYAFYVVCGQKPLGGEL